MDLIFFKIHGKHSFVFHRLLDHLTKLRDNQSPFNVHTKGVALFVIILRTYLSASRIVICLLYLVSEVRDTPNSLRRVHSPELGDLLPRSPM